MQACKLRNVSAAAVFGAALAASLPAFGAEDLARDYRFGDGRAGEELLSRIANLPHTLGDAIRAVEREGEAVTLAKFEINDDGELFLTLLTSERGFERDADNNVLKQYRGKVTRDSAWRPEGRVLREPELVARAAEHHTLMAMSRHSLGDIAREAEGEGDKVLWVQPRILDGRPVFNVGVIRNDSVRTINYDLMRGNRLQAD